MARENTDLKESINELGLIMYKIVSTSKKNTSP